MQWFTRFHALKRNHSATTQSACPSNQLLPLGLGRPEQHHHHQPSPLERIFSARPHKAPASAIPCDVPDNLAGVGTVGVCSQSRSTLLSATKATVCSSHAVGGCAAKRQPSAATAASCAADANLQQHEGTGT